VGGLGVHLTLDLAGHARFGPDVEWVADVDYKVDLSPTDGFYAAIKAYWPDLPDGSLQPGFSGIRPKIAPPGGSETDFLVQSEKEHGIPGLFNLFGIDSPASRPAWQSQHGSRGWVSVQEKELSFA
jgi:L-2-hydroxyglutarate oxidase LhgO